MAPAPSAPHRSWVGLASSLAMHVLFIACVWLLTGTFVASDGGEAIVRMVGLVSGEARIGATHGAGETTASLGGTPASPAPRDRLSPERLSVGAPRGAPAGPRVARAAAAPAIVSAPPRPPEPAAPAATTPEPSPEPAPPVPAAAAPAPRQLGTAAALPAPDADPSPEPVVAAAAVTIAALPRETPDEPAPAAARPEFERLQTVMADATVAARAEGEPFLGRREIFEFLLDHLELATHVTRVLRVARYRVWRTPDGLMLDDGWGALLNVSLVEASRGTRVIYARGKYHRTLLPDIRGEAVMTIEYATTPAEGGLDLVSAAVTSHVRVENKLVALLLKMAQTAVTEKAELESRRLVRTFARVSRAIEQDPARVFEEVRHSPGVPQEDLEEFRRLLRVP